MTAPRMLPIACLLLTPIAIQAEEWSRFRGPNGAGVSAAALPAEWTEKNIAWKTEVPGVGYSSPIVWGKKIFLTSADAATGKRRVLCYSADDGKELWCHEAAAGKYRIHQRQQFRDGNTGRGRESRLCRLGDGGAIHGRGVRS